MFNKKDAKHTGAPQKPTEVEVSATIQKKPIYKRPWFIVIIVLLVLGLIGSIGGGSGTTSSTSNSTPSTKSSQTTKKIDKNMLQSVYEQYSKYDAATLAKYTKESQDALAAALAEAKAVLDKQDATDSEIQTAYDNIMTAVKNLKEPEVSTEYKNALKKAQTYSDRMYMSKQGIYKQLTSEYGEGFPADAAQYAIDNVKADWNYNALQKAKTYFEKMSMSKSAIYDQLVSSYGEDFTPEEAQYAVDHLE